MTYAQRTLLALAGFVLLGQAPAQATEYPYCMTYSDGWGGAVERCDYSTMAQCYASTGGLNGTCAPNWRLAYTRGASSVQTQPDAPAGGRKPRQPAQMR